MVKPMLQRWSALSGTVVSAMTDEGRWRARKIGGQRVDVVEGALVDEHDDGPAGGCQKAAATQMMSVTETGTPLTTGRRWAARTGAAGGAAPCGDDISGGE